MAPCRRQVFVAALAILAIAAVAGCGEDSSSSGTAGDSGAWTLGSWHGELSQEGLQPFEVWATVRSTQSGDVNRVRYSGLECRGQWVPLGGDGSVFRFQERITAGRSDTCKGVGTVTLRRLAADRLGFTFRGGGVESRGVLRPDSQPGGAAAPEASRDALAQSDAVQGAPNRELVLSRVVIPPGAKLDLHHHLGTQVAHIVSGVLTYTVQDGSVAIHRGQSDQDPRVVRTIDAGQTGQIRAGEWIVEQPSDIHRAANDGAGPVVVYLATLLKAGAPPATPVSP